MIETVVVVGSKPQHKAFFPTLTIFHPQAPSTNSISKVSLASTLRMCKRQDRSMIDWLETPVQTHYQASTPSIVTRMINRPTPSIRISKLQTSVIIINAWFIRTIALQIDWCTAAGIKVKPIDKSTCSEVFLKRLRAIIYSRITRSTKMAEILQIMLRGVGLSRLAIITITASYSKAQRSTTSSTSSSTIVIRMLLKTSEERPWMSVESSITKR